MKKILNIGFIGGAYDSAIGYSHFVGCRMDKRFELVAGNFSRNEEHNLKSAEMYGIDTERVYKSYAELIEKEKNNLDVVAVLLPTPSHYEAVSECLIKGIPVICEKTLVMSSDECIRLMEIRDANKGFLSVVYNYTGYPMIRELREMIKNNKLGKIMHFQIEMPQESYIRVNKDGKPMVPQAWRLEDKSIPIMYLDLGSHAHHMIHYLTRETPLEVVAQHSSNGYFSNVIDNVSCLCKYSNGIQGQIWFSKSALGNRNGLKVRIYGSEASAEWVQVYPEELNVAYADGRRETLDRGGYTDVAGIKRYTRFKSGHPAGFVEAFANLYYDMADAIEMHKEEGIWNSEEVFGGELALEGLRFLEAMVRSAGTKSWVKYKPIAEVM